MAAIPAERSAWQHAPNSLPRWSEAWHPAQQRSTGRPLSKQQPASQHMNYTWPTRCPERSKHAVRTHSTRHKVRTRVAAQVDFKQAAAEAGRGDGQVSNNRGPVHAAGPQRNVQRAVCGAGRMGGGADLSKRRLGGQRQCRCALSLSSASPGMRVLLPPLPPTQRSLHACHPQVFTTGAAVSMVSAISRPCATTSPQLSKDLQPPTGAVHKHHVCVAGQCKS